MGLIQRIRRLTVARIENFLNTVEDPEVIFPQLVREMEDQVRAAISAETKALTALKAAEREACQQRHQISLRELGLTGENREGRSASFDDRERIGVNRRSVARRRGASSSPLGRYSASINLECGRPVCRCSIRVEKHGSH